MPRHALILILTLAAPVAPVYAQGGNPPSPRALAQREASRFDGEGRHAEARAIWQQLIDEAPDAAARAAAQRRMAMSHGFEGHCAVTVRYHQMVIDYWKTREAEEPQNAFYQQGEMANEGARVCIDAGDLDTAERFYRLGYELGNKEPEPRTHPRSLWDYRMAHALGRLAARRGDKAEADRQVAEARRILDADSTMAEGQERFYPYLVGYVALYTDDLTRAEAILTEALAVRGNQNDPFLHALLGMAHERLGHADRARELYQRAYDLATGHNPPAAFARPFARRKLGGEGAAGQQGSGKRRSGDQAVMESGEWRNGLTTRNPSSSCPSCRSSVRR
jgi:tetratricopeptide (TPR) repeat protein